MSLRLRNSQLKHLLNKLIDEAVHGNKPAKDLGTILVDEALHTLVEGEFRPDKLIRYQILPMLNPRKTKPRKRRRRGKG